MAGTARTVDPQDQPLTGAPVGHAGTRVEIDERAAWTAPGWLALLVLLLVLVAAPAWVIASEASVASLAAAGVGVLVALVLLASLVVVAPGQTWVVQFFGGYVGTVRRTGLVLVAPLTTRRKVSVRVNNFETARLKVNDADGNPVDVAAIVVWQVADTAKATFAVESYFAFIEVQAEAALRHVAGTHPYDAADDVPSLRGSTDMVAGELAGEVAARVALAGVEVVEVRISHLAYAQEIAQAMLQRQQASAVVAARTRIVDGAVGMVELALERLSERGVVELDEERKAVMVSNLLVVLCGDSRVTPVVNAGSLHA